VLKKPQLIAIPKNSISSRELVETRLIQLVEKEGAAIVARKAEISVSMLHRILRLERVVSPQLAAVLGYELRELRCYVPKPEKRGKR
jgi:hypothetical protein